MWKLEEMGIVRWSDGDSSCRFDMRGGTESFSISPFVEMESSSRDSCLLVSAIEGQCLPKASEQYVCRNRYTINYPQENGLYAIRFSIEPISSTKDRLILEFTISIQTDLLDTHPMLDLHGLGRNAKSLTCSQDQENWRADLGDLTSKTDPINTVEVDGSRCAVLLDRHDAPTTKNLGNQGELRLRLFGDFLEKGVIRTARPWVVFDRSGDQLDEKTLDSLYQDQEKRPLPLAT